MIATSRTAPSTRKYDAPHERDRAEGVAKGRRSRTSVGNGYTSRAKSSPSGRPIAPIRARSGRSARRSRRPSQIGLGVAGDQPDDGPQKHEAERDADDHGRAAVTALAPVHHEGEERSRTKMPTTRPASFQPTKKRRDRPERVAHDAGRAPAQDRAALASGSREDQCRPPAAGAVIRSAQVTGERRRRGDHCVTGRSWSSPSTSMSARSLKNAR